MKALPGRERITNILCTRSSCLLLGEPPIDLVSPAFDRAGHFPSSPLSQKRFLSPVIPLASIAFFVVASVVEALVRIFGRRKKLWFIAHRWRLRRVLVSNRPFFGVAMDIPTISASSWLSEACSGWRCSLVASTRRDPHDMGKGII
ncbi:hypothetical protein P154DRAFT_265781 [Amniculicola lignicola CBS 123094]|uniref:Uncharacterized protein n=1 Tax=Amniculicola lignicola CBS 123094 TaxID=1392246 RepID=A0A6A5WAT7_9PLEO|nr:hypothetical protein P154DRAFT_265781 [Amniculicola lignicola CBS 123094]